MRLPSGGDGGRAQPRFLRPSDGRIASSVLLGLITLWPSVATADPDRTAGTGDQFELYARSETYAELFRRALLPGPNGALVYTRTLLPVQEYVFLNVHDLDTPWNKDGVDVELAAWGEATLGNPSPEHALDGDIQTANILLRQGRVSVRLGRQHVAGGAARYARFDGGDVRIDLGAGFDVEGYGGYTVLPRWDERPGYYLLGAAADTSLKDPTAMQAPPRSSTWLAGSRVGYGNGWARAGLSFHEERVDGLIARADLGADARLNLPDTVVVAGNALLDVDERRLADARLSANATPVEKLDVTVDYLHAAPALLLSRQSVLSVFSTDSYDEAGGYATLRALPSLRLESSGFFDVYDRGRPGARGTVAVRALPDPAGRTTVRVEYTRLVAPDNGYHAVRLSLARRFEEAVTGTLEAYGYFYDAPIRNVRTSSVYAGTLSWQARKSLNLLIGASLANSPYARLDAETEIRVVCELDRSRGVAR